MSKPAAQLPSAPPAEPALPADHALLRRLPAVSQLAEDRCLTDLCLPTHLRVLLAREAVAATRAAILGGDLSSAAAIALHCDSELRNRAKLLSEPSLRPVLNGLGVLLHTNAGRAPLPRQALQAALHAVSGYNALEISMATGSRGSRQDHCRPLLRWLSGAQDALVVNNGAAAILLALKAVAHGRPVLVSRGELVEIGGGFRVPEVMEASGAQLREVGTTNRTHLRDYERELQHLADLGTPAAAVLQVHRSNFAVVGFEAHPQFADLAALAKRFGAAMIVDLGSGALSELPVRPAPLPDGSLPDPEPTLAAVVAAGADAVTCSGDKLIGGPQAGLIVGRTELLARMNRDPLARALRCGSLVLATLQQVLRLHLLGETEQIPPLRQLSISEGEIDSLAQFWAGQLRPLLPRGWRVDLAPAVAQVGGGTHPLLVLPSRALGLWAPGLSAEQLSERLRGAAVPVLGRPRGELLWLDVRSLQAGQADRSDAQLLALIAQAAATAAADN